MEESVLWEFIWILGSLGTFQCAYYHHYYYSSLVSSLSLHYCIIIIAIVVVIITITIIIIIVSIVTLSLLSHTILLLQFPVTELECIFQNKMMHCHYYCTAMNICHTAKLIPLLICCEQSSQWNLTHVSQWFKFAASMERHVSHFVSLNNV